MTTSIHVTTTVPPYNPNAGHLYADFERFIQSVNADKFREHHVTDDPATADIILFVGSRSPDLRDVTSHHLVKTYREKCFVFHMGDRIIPRMPGVYTCLEKAWHNTHRTRSGHYTQIYEYEHIGDIPAFCQYRYLFSFVGRTSTHPVRRRIIELKCDESLIRDTNSATLLPEEYAKSILESKFVLCPRGLGASSFRLFECLKAGRVPVIIADDWVLPSGPDWNLFSVTVRERDVQQIPRMLLEIESNAADMGKQARQVYQDWFSREATYHRVAEWCLEIKNSRRIPERILRHGVTAAMLRPSYLASRLARISRINCN